MASAGGAAQSMHQVNAQTIYHTKTHILLQEHSSISPSYTPGFRFTLPGWRVGSVFPGIRYECVRGRGIRFWIK